MIEPKILKGFRDSLPKAEMIKQTLIDKLRNSFKLKGFLPIDTPALEYSEILLGKGGGETDKQVFRFKDNGERDVSLRFDHTVPLARFSALNYESLTFPFKCYQISKVWRGEKPQKGRYREFTQCDFDILGSDNLYSDLQILLLVCESFKNLNMSEFKIHVSHRDLLNTYLKSQNISNENNEVLKALDKIKKIGIDNVKEILVQNNISEKNISDIFKFTSVSNLADLSTLFEKDNVYLNRLVEIFNQINDLKLSEYFILDTSITRGLDYYTGIVFETFLTTHESIGSVCSGGRYDDLSSLYINKKIPGVGGSIGLDRLLSTLSENDNDELNKIIFTHFLITNEAWAFKLQAELNSKNISSDIYCGNKSKGHQYAYAQSLSIPYVISSYDERSKKYTVKDINKMEMLEDLSIKDLIGLTK